MQDLIFSQLNPGRKIRVELDIFVYHFLLSIYNRHRIPTFKGDITMDLASVLDIMQTEYGLKEPKGTHERENKLRENHRNYLERTIKDYQETLNSDNPLEVIASVMEGPDDDISYENAVIKLKTKIKKLQNQLKDYQ